MSNSYIGNGDGLMTAELWGSGGGYHCLAELLIDLSFVYW